MLNIFKNFLTSLGSNTSQPLKRKRDPNEEIILAYKILTDNGSIPANEPNYELAKKVFLDFNDFNLKNLDNDLLIYLGFIPRSLLPYPKNYIKCAYYLFLEKLQKEGDVDMCESVDRISVFLFNCYPDYDRYKANLQHKKWLDNEPKLKELNCRETFKRLYGVYEVSEEDYYSSPSSIDIPNDKLIHDFGVLPEIEEDVDLDELIKVAKK